MEDVERRGTKGRFEQNGGVFVPCSRTHPFVGPLLYLIIRSGMDLLKATNIRIPSSKLKEQLSPFGGVGDTPYIECQNSKRMHNHQEKSDNSKQGGTRSVRGIKGIGRSEDEGLERKTGVERRRVSQHQTGTRACAGEEKTHHRVHWLTTRPCPPDT